MRIRDAKISDAPRLLEIYAYYVVNTAITFEYDVPALDAFVRRMESIMERYPYLVAEADGIVQGYAYANVFVGRAAYRFSCELSIYADRDARGKGCGRALYEALEARLKAMGIRNLYACIADPDREDEYLTRNSEQFHRHLGFTKVGAFHHCGFKFNRWYNMIWMEKIIGEHACAEADIVNKREVIT